MTFRDTQSLELLLLDRLYTNTTSCQWPVVTTSLAPFPRYYHFSSVHEWQWPWEVKITSCMHFPIYV